MEVTDFTTFRRAAYRLLAALFLYPDKNRWDNLLEGVEFLIGGHEISEVFFKTTSRVGNENNFFTEWTQFLSSLKSLKIEQSLQEEYVRLFVASRNGLCHPYEGAYLKDLRMVPLLLSVLDREYAREGLVVSRETLLDHISVELEYMSFLCGKEEEAEEGPKEILQKELSFIEKHLWWVPEFSVRVRSGTKSIYGSACVITERFIEQDKDFIQRNLSF